MLHSPPPKTKLGLQLKYTAINLNNQLKTSWREALNQGFTEEATWRQAGKAETGKELVPLPRPAAEILEGYLGYKGSSWEL